MDTRQVVLADAFATEPGGGVPVAVLPDAADLGNEQVRAVARELAALVTTVPTDSPPESLRAVGPRGTADPHAVAVAAIAVAAERGWLDGDDDGFTLTIAGADLDVTVAGDGRAWVDIDEPDPQTADVDVGAVADALGIDGATLRDVGADLPPFRVSAGVEALAVPVNFLEHLGSATPDPAALGALAGVDVVCPFTFDTLAADTACHARTFVPRDTSASRAGSARSWVRETGSEVPVVPGVAAGVATHLVREGVVEAAEPVVEGGHYLDRPGRVHVDPDGPRVGGRAVLSLDGRVTVPPAGDDDILEL